MVSSGLTAAWEARGWLVRDGGPALPQRVDAAIVAPLLRDEIAAPDAKRVNA